MDFDETLELIKDYLQKDKCKILNPLRYADIIESYKILKSILDKDCDETTIEIRLCPANRRRRDGNNHTNAFRIQYDIIFQKADIVSIYPTIDDRIQIDAQFRNVFFVTTV